MRKATVGIALSALLLVAAGCSNKPEIALARHLGEMVTLIEQNKEDAAKAAEAVEGYVTAHEAELKKLQQQLEEQRKTMSREELADLASEFLLEMGPIMERAARLMKENPMLGKSERLQKALDTIRRM